MLSAVFHLQADQEIARISQTQTDDWKKSPVNWWIQVRDLDLRRWITLQLNWLHPDRGGETLHSWFASFVEKDSHWSAKHTSHQRSSLSFLHKRHLRGHLKRLSGRAGITWVDRFCTKLVESMPAGVHFVRKAKRGKNHYDILKVIDVVWAHENWKNFTLWFQTFRSGCKWMKENKACHVGNICDSKNIVGGHQVIRI